MRSGKEKSCHAGYKERDKGELFWLSGVLNSVDPLWSD